MIVLSQILSLLIPGTLFVVGLRLVKGISQRHDGDVLADLKRADEMTERLGFMTPLACVVSATNKAASFEIPLCVSIAIAGNFLIADFALSRVIGSLVIGVATGILLRSARQRNAIGRKKHEIEYFLPIVMERIVMAVEAGMDIIPAIEAVVALENEHGQSADPVTTLFAEIPRYLNAGITFVDALEIVAKQVDAHAFRHALVHLGIAYREGGEIILPLRELSDATQLYFQETVEEEIAKMPVKATLPLLCTFAGLIILFLTTPLIQVLSISNKAMPQ